MWELEGPGDRSSTRSAVLLVTGVFGVFVSLDLFFSSSSTTSLPMYLLIAIWGSREVRPGIFAWASSTRARSTRR